MGFIESCLFIPVRFPASAEFSVFNNLLCECPIQSNGVTVELAPLISGPFLGLDPENTANYWIQLLPSMMKTWSGQLPNTN